ncbi:MAG: molecular chaperone [Micropepsaceae bacterium]
MHLSFRVGASRLCAALVAALFCAPAYAASLEVAPTKLTIDGKTGATTLTLANRGTQPIIVQLEGFTWDQAGNEDVLKPTDAVLVSPPMARIPAGGKQVVRVMVKPGAPGVERTYRLFASELPDPANNESRTIRVLLQFSVPLFVGTPEVPASQIKWDARIGAGGLSLSANNFGRAHLKFTKLELVTQGGRRMTVSAKAVPYVLSGATKTWPIAGGFADGERVTVEGLTDSSDAAIRETIVVHR